MQVPKLFLQATNYLREAIMVDYIWICDSIMSLSRIIVEFCSEWPKVLSTDEMCDKLFPIEIITRDVVADGSIIRDPRSRVVTLQVNTASSDTANT